MRTARLVILLVLITALWQGASANTIVSSAFSEGRPARVLLGGQAVILLNDWGGLTARARADIVASRLLNLIEFGDPYSISVEASGEIAVVKSNLGLLVTADPQSAMAEGVRDSVELAEKWALRLRQVIGAEARLMPDPPTERSEMHVALKSRGAAGRGPAARSHDATTAVSSVAGAFEGTASWYGPGFHGRKTASGDIFDQNAMTAAHRTLPFGTRLRVTDLVSGSSVEVIINDRGPFVDGRVLDLSRGAATKLGMLDRGLSRVKAEIVARAR